MHSLDHVSERPEIDSSGPQLVYVQVADHLAGRIQRGELAPGSRLPPERELAAFYGVAYDTVRRATSLLRERGLIVTVHGRGTFVAER
jgi:DNA-binding GntR family transcriptional regulator